MKINLSKSELVVMHIIWNNPNGISISEIYQQLAYKNWTLSTTQSLITRLVSKNAIKVEYIGRKRIFYPCISKKIIKMESIKDFLSQWYKESPSELIFDLIQLNLINKNDLDKLHEYINI